MAETEISQHAIERATAAIASTVELLETAGVRPEALAEYVPAGKRLGIFPKPATMRAIAEVWRLGSLLIGTDHTIWAAGPSTRAAERGRVGYQSVSREERRDIAAAALRGGYAIGTAVNYDAIPVQLGDETMQHAGATLPLGIYAGEVRVRWQAGASLEGAPTLSGYLAERSTLLVNRASA